MGAIEKADKIAIELGTEFTVEIDYANFQNLQYYCQKNGIKIIESIYEEKITCHIIMNNKIKQKFLEDIAKQKLMITKVKELETRLVSTTNK